ncbi:dynamin family protein [Brachybacterium fresconis]|uniref:Energy-coupling factor transporter ATP-binding protein EcfA2 n=1 Tax=Brachybacterium fresconis TaxID=173363 RepID=A0ABS4YJ25_9MICO|nr:dynamin family protein [Brachybacterium fresconis]MBP2408615.1 energy-coupling factor transporter ATP-binding protein EcfA2 [Brachybacterium fresconis]
MTTQPTTVLDAFAEHLRALELPLPVDGADRARAEVSAALSQLGDHVIPRLESLDAPLLAVIGGSTGAGKSTLVNALVGEVVSRSGAIRPTTRRPVLLHHRDDEPWFTGTRILPGLARVHAGSGPGAAGERTNPAGAVPAAAGEDPEAPHAGDTTGDIDPATSLELHAESRIPPGLALLDAPDIDSVAAGNRDLSRQLLRAADLWLFVTTANRYADAVPWEVLRTAAERDVTVDVVMNRIPQGAGISEELADDLRGMLERNGIEVARLFLVPETELDESGMLPPTAVAELQEHLTRLAADAEARGRIARRTLAGAVTALAGSTRQIAEHASAQQAERERLRQEATEAFTGSRERIDEALGDGSLLRGEVLARWQDVVGTGEMIRGLESFVARVRDRVGLAVSGKPAPSVAAEQALGTGLVHVVVDETARGAERAEAAWRATASGRSLAEGQDLSRIPEGYREEVAAGIRAWQGDVLDLVREEGSDRRTKARVLSLGVNVVGVALMVVVFASTAFIPTGLEVGAGAATAVVGQKLLETVFGDEAVRRMARVARERLTARLDALVAERSTPFLERLDDLGRTGSEQQLESDAAALEQLAREIREAA